TSSAPLRAPKSRISKEALFVAGDMISATVAILTLKQASHSSIACSVLCEATGGSITVSSFVLAHRPSQALRRPTGNKTSCPALYTLRACGIMGTCVGQIKQRADRAEDSLA